jgi:6-phosphofructokinase 1
MASNRFRRIGRDTGWIALEAGIAGGADVILIPEIPYNLDVIAEKIRSRHERGAKFSIVVTAEGALPKGGQPTYLGERRPGATRRLGGIGTVVAEQLMACCDVEVRVTVLDHLQRGGSPTAADRLLGSRFGNKAVHLIAENKLGHMVALQNDQIVAVPIQEAVAGQKFVPLDNDLIYTAFGLDLCLGDSRLNIQNLQTNNSHQESMGN